MLSIILWLQVLLQWLSLFLWNFSPEGLFLCYVQLISVEVLLRHSPSQGSAQCCFSRVQVYYLLITGVLQTFGSLSLLSLFDRTTVEVLLSAGAPGGYSIPIQSRVARSLLICVCFNKVGQFKWRALSTLSLTSWAEKALHALSVAFYWALNCWHLYRRDRNLPGLHKPTKLNDNCDIGMVFFFLLMMRLLM